MSATIPSRTSTRRFGRPGFTAAVAFVLPLLLGGCMSRTSPTDPIPVMARQEAQDWAQHMTEYMAQTAGGTITPDTVRPSFRQCVGKNDEVANDGRYTMSYAAYSPIALEQHPEAARRIRTMLEQQEFQVSGYRETLNGKVQALLDAFQPSGRYLVSVETMASGDLMFRISTRCLMPPSAKPDSTG
ncbi:hypothetical protein [Kitasatospora sp. NPDC093806]|uniref:hypothetical protein n=1 Tax=Kitasatospora sp. NPDC093806 TaxID=3155075 RepID=UPI0034250163